MINRLIEYFEQNIPLSADEKAFVAENIPVRTIEKNEIILKSGEVSSEFFFLIEGCIRLFYTFDGEDKTGFFYIENDFVSSYASFTKRLPSKHNLQALERTMVAVINFETAQEILERFPKFEMLARLAMEQELSICQEVIASFVTTKPIQRYLDLQSSRPDLIQRVPQHYLATFLGVTPETLSRIRKRILANDFLDDRQ
ncbi:MAG: Crp/Fnr family transcriptional regulator [Bacteroidota bacterium]